ncbi:response regulator transcription factor [Marinibactrum halimedae]|uniref:DNA-binding response regulator n=1 Tax=Marinibactrum halimedae TaxID=1444977 RepID=A0AA37WMB5_9GAMM|nr:response regulator transcription factor [Marinibactrum halimedae]MCD9458408.1 response regulator transcription factor [Marinibactrum halimedae]GLS26105.1 DNA-binding response regulator [Marinibactrum halimedae]
MNNILLIDDDLELCDLLKEYLHGEGYDVTLVHDGGEACQTVRRQDFDAIVLDVMLPTQNGFEVLTEIREQSNIPILMLTAKGDSADRIVGLESGADDYLPKPCNPRELVARLNAIQRRMGGHPPTPKEVEVSLSDITLNRGNRTCFYKEEPLSITGAEFSILEMLMQHAGDILSKETLTEKALKRKLTPYDRSIDVHVSNIRKKLTKIGAPKDQIINVRGAGYMFTLPANH